jgi:hypothetical protein
MALFQVLVASSFKIQHGSKAQVSLLIVGMYLFAVAYSPGEGPVPFVSFAQSICLLAMLI